MKPSIKPFLSRVEVLYVENLLPVCEQGVPCALPEDEFVAEARAS